MQLWWWYSFRRFPAFARCWSRSHDERSRRNGQWKSANETTDSIDSSEMLRACSWPFAYDENSLGRNCTNLLSSEQAIKVLCYLKLIHLSRIVNKKHKKNHLRRRTDNYSTIMITLRGFGYQFSKRSFYSVNIHYTLSHTSALFREPLFVSYWNLDISLFTISSLLFCTVKNVDVFFTSLIAFLARKIGTLVNCTKIIIGTKYSIQD